MKTMVSFLCYHTLNAICLPYDAAAVYWQRTIAKVGAIGTSSLTLSKGNNIGISRDGYLGVFLHLWMQAATTENLTKNLPFSWVP